MTTNHFRNYLMSQRHPFLDRVLCTSSPIKRPTSRISVRIHYICVIHDLSSPRSSVPISVICPHLSTRPPCHLPRVSFRYATSHPPHLLRTPIVISLRSISFLHPPHLPLAPSVIRKAPFHSPTRPPPPAVNKPKPSKTFAIQSMNYLDIGKEEKKEK